VKAFNEMAEAYEEKFMHLDLYNESYDRFCLRIEKKGAKILELGCGPGNITKYILEKRPDLKILATDLAPKMLALAKKNNPGTEFRLLDLRNLRELPEKYEGLICGFSIPYLSKTECEKLVSDAARIMSEKGIFYFSFIEGDHKNSAIKYSSDKSQKCFVYYYESAYFKDLLDKNGFRLKDEFRISYPVSPETEHHLVLIAEKTA
jgi:ubiquinone/menaquinone biosynthesis C-methylase UbiE